MDIGKRAHELHDEGYNCAQCVLCAVAEHYGKNADNLKAVSAGCGGGMRCGEVCGTVSGAIMAAGLAIGDGVGSPSGVTADCARAISGAFMKEYGLLRCQDLVREAGKTRCDEFIEFSSELAVKVIDEIKGEEK